MNYKKLEQEILKIRKLNSKLKKNEKKEMELENNNKSKFQQIISELGFAYSMFSSTLNSDLATFESTVKGQETFKENLSNKYQSAIDQLVKTSVFSEISKVSVSKSFVDYSNLYPSSFDNNNESKIEQKNLNSISDSNQNYSILSNKIDESKNNNSSSNHQEIYVLDTIKEEESKAKLNNINQSKNRKQMNLINKYSQKEIKNNSHIHKKDFKQRIRIVRKSTKILENNNLSEIREKNSEIIPKEHHQDNSIDSLLLKLNDSNIDKEFGPKKEVKLEDLLAVKSIMDDDILNEKLISKKTEIKEKLNDIDLEDLLNISENDSLPISIQSISENNQEDSMIAKTKMGSAIEKEKEKEKEKKTEEYRKPSKNQEIYKGNDIDDKCTEINDGGKKINYGEKEGNSNFNYAIKPEAICSDKIKMGRNLEEKSEEQSQMKNHLEKRVKHYRNALEIIQEMNSELSNSNSILCIPNQKVNKSVEYIENSRDINSINEKSSARFSYNQKYKEKGEAHMKQSFSISEINSRKNNYTDDFNLNKLLNVKSVIVESVEEGKEQEDNVLDKIKGLITEKSNINRRKNDLKSSPNSKDRNNSKVGKICCDYNSIISKLKNKNPKIEKRINSENRKFKWKELNQGKKLLIKMINPKYNSRNETKNNLKEINPEGRKLSNEKRIINVSSDDRLETFTINNIDNQNHLELNSLHKVDSFHHSSIVILFGISNSSFKISDFPTSSHFGSMISKGISKIVKLHNQNTTTKKQGIDDKEKEFQNIRKDNEEETNKIPKTKLLNKNKTEAIRNEGCANPPKININGIHLKPFKKMKIIKKIISGRKEN